jgi:acetyl-CoA carboxylase carboxyltransferase component
MKPDTDAESKIKVGDKVRLTSEARARGVRLTKTDTNRTPAAGTVTGFGREGQLCYVCADDSTQRTQYAIDSLEKVAGTASDEDQ